MKTIFSILLITLYGVIFTQTPAEEVLQLETVLQKAGTDTGRAQALFDLSQYWSGKDTARSLTYARRALELPLDEYYKGVANFYAGNACFDFDIKKAEQYYLNADKLLRAYDDSRALIYRSRAWANIGSIQQRRNDNRGYIDILLNRSIPLAAAAGDSVRMARQYMNVGLPFMNYKEYDRAISYYQKAIRLFLRQGARSLSLADCYSNAAKAYLLSNRLAPARTMLDSAGAILSKEKPSAYHTYFYSQEALYYSHSKQWEASEKSLSDGMAIAKAQQSSRDMVMLLFGYVDLYTEQQKMPELRAILLKLHEDQENLAPVDHQQILLDLARTDSALNRQKEAYQWLSAYAILSDSINKAQISFQLAELETKFNFNEKEKELSGAIEKSKIQKLLLAGSLCLLLLVVVVSILAYRQRKNKIVGQMRSLRQQQRLAVSRALLDGEERERGRVARDLHDGLGGMLAGLKMRLSAMSMDNSEPFRKVIIQLDQSVDELRRIARNLMPGALMRSGLETALKDLCQSFSNDKMIIDLQLLNIERSLPTQVQLIIYRIVQELLTNVVRHAAATEVFVQCSQLNDLFSITMEDNGRGFEPESVPDAASGIGLANIRNRVEFLQGTMHISSSSGKGTITNIELLCRKE